MSNLKEKFEGQREYIDYFNINLNDKIFNVYISFSHIKNFDNNELIETFLNNEEFEYYKKLLYKKKINSFLLGRYSAKRVVAKSINEKDLKKINIRNGVFGQPIIRGELGNKLNLSLSHCNEVGVALAFSNMLILGIDIEKINYKINLGVKSQVTEHEKMLMCSKIDSYERFSFMIWTIKEAISKALRTGFTVDLNILEIEHIKEYDDYFISTFKYFMQYKVITFFVEDYICSIAYPANSQVNINIKRIKNNLLKILTNETLKK